jgi:hypothetical protein
LFEEHVVDLAPSWRFILDFSGHTGCLSLCDLAART